MVGKFKNGGNKPSEIDMGNPRSRFSYYAMSYYAIGVCETGETMVLIGELKPPLVSLLNRV